MGTQIKKNRKSALAILGTILISSTLIWGPAQAAPVLWSDATGFWDVAGNWSPGVPGPADDVTINVAGVQTITHRTGNDTVSTLTIGTSTDTLLINSGSSLAISNGGANVGTMQADGAGSALSFNGGTVNNTGGLIEATNSGVVNLRSVAIQNGTLATSGGGLIQANGSTNNFLNGVTLNGTLDMTSVGNSRERVVNGITINGAVNIANSGILSINGGTQTIGGSGTINLNDSSARVALEGNGTTTIDTNLVVRGQGSIGTPIIVGGTNNLVNNGLISADVSGGTLTIVPGAGNGNLTNNSTLQATGGGTLQLNNLTVNNAGLINAQNGSVVLQSGSTIIGGTIGTAGSTGVFRADGSSANFLNGVTLSGTLDTTSIGNSRERVVNGITINGAVNIANSGILSINGGTQTIGGSGTINLNDSSARVALEGNGTTTIDTNLVVRGQGTIGTPNITAGTNNLVNNGLISADVSGGTLTIVPGAGNGNLTNNSTLQATGGGTLRLSGVTVTNGSGGLINAQNGSVVLQTGSAINGGTIGTAGTGVFRADGNGANFLSSVTLNGTLDMTSIGNSRERVVNGITINGAVNIGGSGVLSLDSTATSGGNQTISGSGTINLNDSSARVALEGNGTTTIDTNLVVRGQGSIGTPIIVGGTNNLVNNGRISADVSGQTLQITPGASSGNVTNNSLLDARNGGTLQLSGVTINNASGLINAQNGSVVLQSGSTIIGGTIGTAGTGVFRADGNSSNILNGVTLSGTLDMTSIGNSRERVVNGITINGAVNIGGSGVLSINGGTQTLGGSGTINLNDAGARLALEGNGTTTIDTSLVVRGQGNIGTPLFAGGTNNLVNLGTIVGDGGTLAIQPGGGNGGFTNNGLVHASNGTVNVNPVPQGNGTLQISGTGQLNLSSAGVNTTGILIHNGVNTGSLNLGSQNLVVLTDYTNANFGVGNAFNRRANVSGTGQILAAVNVAQAVTGTNVTGGTTATPTLTIGNVHVGATTFNYQIANTGTTGPSIRGAIQTGVNGGNITDSRLSGPGVTASNFGPIAPGANSGNLAVTFTAASAGPQAPLSGQVVHVTNNFDNLNSQNLGITLGAGATAYRLAQATINNAASFNFGNVLVNSGPITKTISISNTATADGFSEALNAAFGSFTNNGAGIFSTNGGSITGLLAGQTDVSAMKVTMTPSSAGTISASVELLLKSNGTAIGNGLGLTDLPSQNLPLNVTITGVAGNLAIASAATPNPVNFGKFRVGDPAPAQQALTIGNLATSPAEGLNASIATGSTGFTATGAFTSLAAGATDSSTLKVGFTDTATAGAKAGTATITLASDGTFNGGVTTPLTPQTINMNAEVYRLANPTLNTPSIAMAARVGDASPSAGISITNTSPDVYTEGLNVTRGATAAGFTSSGSISNLIAGGTTTNAIQVSLNTRAAGTFTGTQALNFVSTGAGTTGAPDVSVGSGSVNLTGKVYTPAVANVGTTNINFGIVHVGDVVPAGNVAVTNGAAVTALNDVLIGTISAGPSPYSASGNLGAGLGAGTTNNTSLNVALNTKTAGVFSGQANLALLSHNTDMADLPLTTSPIALSAQVNNYANPVFGKTSGDGVFSGSGSVFILDFGNLSLNSGLHSALLKVTNDVGSPADTLGGDFDLGDAAFDFVLSGFMHFDGIEAGNSYGPLSVSLNTLNLGSFDDIVAMHSFGHNASGFIGSLPDIELELRGNVISGGEEVPEPSTWLLILSGLGPLAAARRYLLKKR